MIIRKFMDQMISLECLVFDAEDAEVCSKETTGDHAMIIYCTVF